MSLEEFLNKYEEFVEDPNFIVKTKNKHNYWNTGKDIKVDNLDRKQPQSAKLKQVEEVINQDNEKAQNESENVEEADEDLKQYINDFSEKNLLLKRSQRSEGAKEDSSDYKDMGLKFNK